jgi:HEAT repeat protein
MQCCALTPERKRCTNLASTAANYCAAHYDQDSRVTGKNGQAQNPGRLTGIVAQLRSRILGGPNAPISDGGKYDVPAWLKNASTVEVIGQLQTSPDSMVRWMAAFVLRKRRAPEAIQALWDVLKNDNTRFVRQQAAVALGKIGTPLAFSPLVEALNYDRDQGVRQASAIALGNLGYPAAMDEVARVLELEENIFVKWDCIVALGQLGDKRVEKLLQRLQAEEIAQVVREACRDSLVEIRQRGLRLEI